MSCDKPLYMLYVIDLWVGQTRLGITACLYIWSTDSVLPTTV